MEPQTVYRCPLCNNIFETMEDFEDHSGPCQHKHDSGLDDIMSRIYVLEHGFGEMLLFPIRHVAGYVYCDGLNISEPGSGLGIEFADTGMSLDDLRRCPRIDMDKATGMFDAQVADMRRRLLRLDDREVYI